MPYPAVAKRIAGSRRILLDSDSDIESIIVDSTGVGTAVVELITRTLRKHDMWLELEPFESLRKTTRTPVSTVVAGKR